MRVRVPPFAPTLSSCSLQLTRPAPPGYAEKVMSTPEQPQQPQINLTQSPDYRETYANSVQVRVSVWDFQLIFGLASSEAPDQVTIRNHQATFLSPQQAKALWNILGQNLAQYEQAFGEINLEPQAAPFPQGPIN